jgi:hypothetical protein
MAISALEEAVAVVEKANANLEPELMGVDAARSLLASYARIRKLASYGEAVLARRVEDASEIARLSAVGARSISTSEFAANAVGGRMNVTSERFQWASVPEQAPQGSRNRKSPLRRGGWADNGEGSGPGGRGLSHRPG